MTDIQTFIRLYAHKYNPHTFNITIRSLVTIVTELPDELFIWLQMWGWYCQQQWRTAFISRYSPWYHPIIQPLWLCPHMPVPLWPIIPVIVSGYDYLLVVGSTSKVPGLSLWGFSLFTLKSVSRHDASFVITGVCAGYHNDNLWCHQWWQSLHHLRLQCY